jgi:hypothetical protein
MIPLLQELGPKKISDPRINQITVQHLLEHRGSLRVQLKSFIKYSLLHPKIHALPYLRY